MRRRITVVFSMIALLLTALPGLSQEAKKPPEPLAIKAGDAAPDFTLLHYDGKGVKPVSLRDFRGKSNVVLAFFVFAFTGG
jgi:cytochrome oxidase Cu insertion factor (SCO1/SenC/PrrC family)